MTGSRIQRHVAGNFDDSDGTIHSENKLATAAAITLGQIVTSNGGTAGVRACIPADKGPVYLANKAKALNDTAVDSLWGDDVIFYCVADGAIPIDSDLECGLAGKLKASGGVNTVVARYVKHGTKSRDKVTPLVAAADGEVIGVKFISRAH